MSFPLSNNPVAATTQAFENNGFPPFIGIYRTSSSSGERADNGTTQCVTPVINFAQNSAGTSPYGGGTEGFLIKLVLVAGEGLAGSQIRLEGCRGLAVQDGLIICPAVSASRDRKNSRNYD
ncbi:hypothetical protein Q4555_16050 [Octadecabacter sp. 1_MG-2023]|uniref:hypothetical protein n=1 Tax=unclassified Octadecabacter TaxID=196158 RepID=UPI001C0885CC|nr:MULTISPECIES: hypothetical protein [unclassified Octadecabacter]MBU2991664.1 hypothetical protein [Octadecabacter sp. B2R22]MDO6736190.1 hypothetical protein [Octadecabacter sp. 1_MG-2023]